jgi:competence protein ComEA
MKYVWAGLAVVAAVAALFFRPPHGDCGAAPAAGGSSRVSAGGLLGAVGAARDASGDSRPGGAGLETTGTSFDAAMTPRSGGKQAAAGDRLHRTFPERIVVYVAGEVTKPGVYTFAPGTRAQEALARAGGPKSDADLVAVNLAAPLDDGAEIAVPKIGATTSRGRRSAGPHVRASHAPRRHGRRRRGNSPDDTPLRSIDLNAADASELEALPGIGSALAARIVDYRETNGPFTSVDELADVSGITPRLQEELADLVVIR